ncbi:MAG: patatin-like phospholipase family protein [Hyphomicrobiales bacterium]|nr:patatin-like phospholipase family protein [Hyphomicrobiales bacterium]
MTDLTETVIERLLDRTGSRDLHLFGPGPKRILSFDGGGVRGAISVAFLERIETLFAAHQRKLLTAYLARLEQAAKTGAAVDDRKLTLVRAKLAAPVCLADWFDLVGGTSTGSLIAGAIALGYNTDDIKAFYLERAPFVFQRPFWRIPGLQAKFDARALQQEIDTIVADRTLGSEDLITGLSVVAKRMDTGSPWILTNNPRNPYWESKPPTPEDPGFIGNRYYKLATLVRASTAAPHFFDPEIVQIIADEASAAHPAGPRDRDWLARLNDRLGRFPRLTSWLTKLRALRIAQTKGPNPKTHGLFVDGGVTPFNNPSLALLMQVVVKPYGICWPLGADKITFVSIGTGSHRAKLSFTELGFAGPLKLALHSLLSMMGDTQTLALAQMQWLGDCPDPWPVNSEIGSLADELPKDRRWFRFMRYDVQLEQAWIKDKLDQALSEATVAAYRNMDDPAIIRAIYELGTEAAKRQVKATHFFPEEAPQFAKA